MIADISFLEQRIEKKIKATQKKRRQNTRSPFYAFLALAIMISGTLGGYLSLHAATSVRRAPLVFQGRITDASYVPIADSTTRRMVFRIHTHATNSACVWSTGNGADTAESANCAIDIVVTGDNASEDNASVATTITRGVFSVPLGDTSYHENMRSIRNAFDNQSSEVYYLEISVKNSSGEYETLSPRIRIGSAAYAYNADELDGLDSASFLRVDGTTTQTAATSGTPTAISFVGAAHTGLTASTESTDISFNLNRTITFATGALTAQRAVRIQAPTYAFAGASTMIHGATFAIGGGPAAGTNATIVRKIGAWITGENLNTGTVTNFMRYSFESAATLGSGTQLVGTMIEFADAGNLTVNGAGGQSVYGEIISLPGATNSNAASLTIKGSQTSGQALDLSNASGSIAWLGSDIQIPSLTRTAGGGTVTATGLSITAVASAGANTTSYALVTNQNAGNIGFGTTAPTYSIEVSRSAGSDPSLSLTDGDVAHGITTVGGTTGISTSTAGLIKPFHSTGGGLEIDGFSDTANDVGLELTGVIGAADPTDTVAAIELWAAKKNGATVQALGNSETVLNIANAGTSALTILGNGSIGIGDTTPDYQLELSAALGINNSLSLSAGDLSHTATTIHNASFQQNPQADTFFLLGVLNGGGAGTGGALMTGISETDSPGMRIMGVIGGNDPTDTTTALYISGAKKNDTTGSRTTLGATETVMIFSNNDTPYLYMLGSGRFGFGNTNTAPDTLVDIAGTFSYTPSTTQDITAATGAILANAGLAMITNTSGIGVNLNTGGGATIANGATGQILYIVGASGMANITINDQDSQAGSNLQLGAASRTISELDVLQLVFNGADWLEVSYTSN